MRKLVCAAALSLVALPAWGQTPNPAIDSDNDGVNDAQDVEPCDDRVSARAFVPSGHVYAMVLFEDNWPHQGDFDFNDAVVAVHQSLELDSAGRMTRLTMNLEVMAAGAEFDNGLAIRLPTASSNILSAKLFGDGDPTPVTDLTLWQTEAQATMTLAPSLHGLFGAPGQRVNAVRGAPAHPYVHLTVVVELAAGALSPAEALFDLFLFDDRRGVEVHLPAYGPTSRMNAALLGTGDDDPQRNFTTNGGIPFALAFFQEVSYPAEGVAIDRLFPEIVAFGASQGAQNQRFFDNPVVSERYIDQYNLSPVNLAFASDRSCFQAVPGACGPAQDVATVVAPASADLCAAGAPSTVVDAGSAFTWTCQGVYSTPTACQTTQWACSPNQSQPCTPSSGAVGVQVCAGDGSQWGTCQFSGCASGYVADGSQCRLRICSPGSHASCTVNGGQGRQTCNVNGTGYSTCLPVINGVCGVAHGRSYGEVQVATYVSGQCASGSPSSPNYGQNGQLSWRCSGARGGATASCGASYVPCSIGAQQQCSYPAGWIRGCQWPGYWGWCVSY